MEMEYLSTQMAQTMLVSALKIIFKVRAPTYGITEINTLGCGIWIKCMVKGYWLMQMERSFHKVFGWMVSLSKIRNLQKSLGNVVKVAEWEVQEGLKIKMKYRIQSIFKLSKKSQPTKTMPKN